MKKYKPRIGMNVDDREYVTQDQSIIIFKKSTGLGILLLKQPLNRYSI